MEKKIAKKKKKITKKKKATIRVYGTEPTHKEFYKYF
jgi:hypothetical protein